VQALNCAPLTDDPARGRRLLVICSRTGTGFGAPALHAESQNLFRPLEVSAFNKQIIATESMVRFEIGGELAGGIFR